MSHGPAAAMHAPFPLDPALPERPPDPEDAEPLEPPLEPKWLELPLELEPPSMADASPCSDPTFEAASNEPPPSLVPSELDPPSGAEDAPPTAPDAPASAEGFAPSSVPVPMPEPHARKRAVATTGVKSRAHTRVLPSAGQRARVVGNRDRAAVHGRCQPAVRRRSRKVLAPRRTRA